jgi:hypothetical protein
MLLEEQITGSFKVPSGFEQWGVVLEEKTVSLSPDPVWTISNPQG